MTRLVIVESPTKAKTIRGFLPKGYRVEACMGHVRDLPESASDIPAAQKSKEWARLGVNVEADFEPLYVVPAKKRKVVQELKDALKEADELILATDEDREGESIGWHLLQVLKPKVPVRRMVFHEITRDAIEEAIRNPRGIDEQVVRAQETRRILDRLVGYTVSPLLWKKIAPGLSAGRVQSVAVRLLVNREEERRAFVSGQYWDLRATLSGPREPNATFEADLQSVGGVRVASGKDFDPKTGQIAAGKKVLLLNESSASALRDRLLKAEWKVAEMTEKQQTRRPPPPFTTSTLQQEANRKLRLAARQTMQIAQKLYEEGHITYMRTDSVHLSAEAISAARRAIEKRYGPSYLYPTPRRYTTRSKGAQEAHEAIRPAGTAMRTADEIGLSGVEASLYNMIWMRTIASQMADAQITSLIVTVAVADALFQASGNRVDFPGFFRAYVEGSDDPDAAIEDREIRLPALQKDDRLTCRKLTPNKHETQPPARYTEAALVQTLEKEGIGRPSTYATIISTIQDRGYVVKAKDQLVPTFTAFAVNRLLEGHFPDLVDTQFTARMEQTLDEIAEGEVNWLPYLKTFYSGETGLESQVNSKTATIDPREIYALALDELNARVRIGRFGPYLEQADAEEPVRVSLPPEMPPAELKPDAALRLLQQKEGKAGELGTHPETGEKVLLLNGPYGPYVQLGEADKAENGSKGAKPKRASLLKGMQPENVTLALALRLLSLPRTLGVHPDTRAEIVANVGRFGPFIKHGEEYRSLGADDDVLTIGLDRALELLRMPKTSGRRAGGTLRDLGPHPEGGESVLVKSGRFGPYIQYGRVFASLGRGANIEALTLAEAVTLLKDRGKEVAAKERKASTRGRKASTSAADGKQNGKTTGKGTGKSTGKTTAKKPAADKKPSKPSTRRKSTG